MSTAAPQTNEEKIGILHRAFDVHLDDFDTETSNLHNALAALLDVLAEREVISISDRDRINAERERVREEPE